MGDVRPQRNDMERKVDRTRMIRGVIECNLDHIYLASNHLTWRKILMSRGESDDHRRPRQPTLGLIRLSLERAMRLVGASVFVTQLFASSLLLVKCQNFRVSRARVFDFIIA